MGMGGGGKGGVPTYGHIQVLLLETPLHAVGGGRLHAVGALGLPRCLPGVPFKTQLENCPDR